MSLVRIGRWFLPWLAVLIVSVTIAHAMGNALERHLGEPPDPIAAAAVAGVHDVCARACPHWVELMSVDTEGHDVTVKCLVADGRYTDDALQVRFADLGGVVANMCSELWR
jgi:hypothetical protein